MIDPQRFETTALRGHPIAASIGAICSAALRSVDPATLVREHVQLTGNRLRVGAHELELAPRSRIVAVGAGKAVRGMVRGLCEVLGDRLVSGLGIDKFGEEERIGPVALRIGGHPVPDARSVSATEALLAEVRGLGPDDVVVVLTSGGASSLATAPGPGIELDALQGLTTHLLQSGAPIEAVNAVRRRLDRIKSGGLARAIHPARCVGLVLSDVPSGRMDVVGSGPTVDAMNGTDIDPGTIDLGPWQAWFDRVRREPEPAPGDGRVVNVRIGGNDTAVAAAAARARAEGFETPDPIALDGEAARTGVALAQRLTRQPPSSRPTCIVAGGETTVNLRGQGRGGRNQELALSAATTLFGRGDVAIVTLATDGEDGPTDAAGAVVTGATVPRALGLGLDPLDHLRRNDAYPLLDALGDLVRTGPTGTNVCDLALLLLLGRG